MRTMILTIGATLRRWQAVCNDQRWFSGIVMAITLAAALSPLRAEATVLQVSGNNAGPVVPIQQWVVSLPAGPFPVAPVVQFVPNGATVPGANGRALGADQLFFYYSELSNGSGPSDGIHVIKISDPLKQDVNIFPNPNPAWGIQDLDVFDVFANPSNISASLYALTGYPSGAPTVYQLSRVDGHVIGSPVILQAPAQPDSDGFTVLPNGNFLVNTGDASPTYWQFDSITGAAIIGSDFTVPCGAATGVDAGPTSLVIQCDFNSFLITDFSGNVLDTVLVNANQVEDIEGIFGPPLLPEPATLGLLAIGLAGIALIRRHGAVRPAVVARWKKDCLHYRV